LADAHKDRRRGGEFQGQFRVVHETSILPGGDRGILRIANSYRLNALIELPFGQEASTSWRERVFIGRELVVVGERI
jgi:ligand-binding sensor domain-containing protein